MAYRRDISCRRVVWRRFALLCLTASLLFPAGALGRKLKIRWDSVPNATKYEISIKQGEREIATAVVDKDQGFWRGDLPAGYFYYSVRAIDRVGRPGEWSKPTPILVKPRAPEPQAPADGSTVKLTAKDARLILRWKTPDAGPRYVVEIEREGKRLPPARADEPEWEVRMPEPGEFRWRVKGIVEAAGAIPADMKHELGTVATSEPSSWQSFDLEADAGYLDAIRKFLPPTLVWPRARVAPSAESTVSLEWQPSSTAEAYEVRVEELKTERGPASSAKGTTKTFVTRETQLDLPVLPNGKYAWRVRALANIDSAGRAGIASAEAASVFTADPDGPERAQRSWLRLRTMVVPFRLQRVAPSRSVRGDIPGTTLSTELGAQLALGGRWTFQSALLLDFHRFDGREATRTDVNTLIEYRLPLSAPSSGWVLDLVAGPEVRHYIAPTPSFSGPTITSPSVMSVESLGVVGHTIGFSVGKRLGRDWNVALGARAFVPFFPFGRKGQQLTQSFNLENNSGELSAQYRLGRSWNLEGRLARERRIVRYGTPGSAIDETDTNAWRMGLALQYLWD